MTESIHNGASHPDAPTMTADEVALYDRQIRLWGMAAQARMQKARILLITIKALGNEIAKNLVLAGIGSLTILDDGLVTEEDLGAQFFVSEQHLGLHRAQAALPAVQALNPRVRCNVSGTHLVGLNQNFIQEFDLIIATDLPLPILLHINKLSRSSSVPFYAGAIHGLYGVMFADLLKCEFVIQREKSNKATIVGSWETSTRQVIGSEERKEGIKTMESVTKTEDYSPLSEVLSAQVDKSWRPKKRRGVSPVLPAIMGLWKLQQSSSSSSYINGKPNLKELLTCCNAAVESLGLPLDFELNSAFIRNFIDCVDTEISPTAAILGGQLAQDVINFLGKREQPLQNIMVFNGDTFRGDIYSLHLVKEKEVESRGRTEVASVVLD